jgi:hypothetical protein
VTRRRDFTRWWPVERAILDCLNEHAWHAPTARVTIKHLAERAECSEWQHQPRTRAHA